MIRAPVPVKVMHRAVARPEGEGLADSGRNELLGLGDSRVRSLVDGFQRIELPLIAYPAMGLRNVPSHRAQM